MWWIVAMESALSCAHDKALKSIITSQSSPFPFCMLPRLPPPCPLQHWWFRAAFSQCPVIMAGYGSPPLWRYDKVETLCYLDADNFIQLIIWKCTFRLETMQNSYLNTWRTLLENMTISETAELKEIYDHCSALLLLVFWVVVFLKNTVMFCEIHLFLTFVC